MKTSKLKTTVIHNMILIRFANNRTSSGQNSRFFAMPQLLHRVVAILALLMTCSGVWAARSAKVTTAVTPAGGGLAYISTSSPVGTNTDATQQVDNYVAATNKTFYVKAVPAAGYEFVRWEFTTSNGTRSIANATSAETTITVQTAGTNNSTRENTIRAVFKLLEGYEEAGYVFYDGNGHYLNSSTDNTAFNPNTSLWTLSSNKFRNGENIYLRLNSSSNLSLSNTDSRNTVVLSETESGTTGQRVYINNSRYLRYNSGWTTTQTASNSGTNVVFAVIKHSYVGDDNTTKPAINTPTRNGNTINFTHTNISGTYEPTYDDYIFYNNTHHYWLNNELVASAPQSKSSWTGATYTWSIVEGGDYVQINATSGALTFKNAIPTAETTVKVRLTTSNISPMSDLTNDFTFTLTPTQGSLTVPAVTGVDVIAANGTYNYSATSTTTPGYSTVTGIGGGTYYVQNGNILTSKPAASTITYAYSLSNNTGYATINSSTGAMTVSSIPATGSQAMTLTVTATAGGMTETATLPIYLTKEDKVTENTGMYVITYQNSHFLGGNSTTDITSFNPATCLWTGTNGGTWRNSAGYYISNDNSNGNLTFGTEPGSTWNISGTESGETGQELYHTSGYYNYSIRWYNSAWTARRNYGTNNRLFAVTKVTYLPFDQNPFIEGDKVIANIGTNSSFSRTQDAKYNAEKYTDYIFYDGAHHYFDKDGTSVNSDPSTKFTYYWSLSDNATGFATIDPSTGVITYTNYVQTDRDITVTLTASATGVSSKTATQTVTLKAPQNPTAITAQNVELAVGDPDYTLTYTLSPSTRVYNYVVASGNSDIVTVSPSSVASTSNTGNFTIHPVSEGNTTLTLSAKKINTSNAEEACTTTVTITVRTRCIRPTITFDNTTGELTMTTTTEGAAIHYTIDGSTPTATSPTYDPDNKPVLTATTTVKAIATKADMMASAVETQTFTQIATPTLTANSDGTVTFSCEEDGVTYYYTANGDAPTLASASSTTGTVSGVTSGSTVKVIAVKEGMVTSQVGSREIRYTVATPVITIDEDGAVTIECATPGATIHYTIDNSVPTTTSSTYTAGFTLTNGQTINAIAVKENYIDSEKATDRYTIQSGISGNTVILNDYEDHTWTYYAGVDASVDGGYYNRTYIAQGTGTKRDVRMYSPNPRNVKITYNAVNDVEGSTITVKVSSREGEGQTSFVYYETLEEGATTGQYPYQVISNPFSVRPSTGTGNSKVFYGFAGWKVKSGYQYMHHANGDAVTENEVLALDENIYFAELPYSGKNCTSEEVVLETTWTPATVKRGGGYVSSNDFSGGTYETNFCVINSNCNALSPSYPVTITGVEPDGSATYTNTIGGTVTPANNTNAGYMTKLEYVTWNPGAAINPQGRNFTIGRGITMSGTTRALYGTNTNATVNQILKVESGTYSGFTNYGTGISSGNITKQWVTLGCDYDRAKNDNEKLNITGTMYVSNDNNVNASSGQEVCRVYSKSGKFVSGQNVSSAAADQSYYFGFSNREEDEGYKYLEIQGGEWCNIAGGMGTSNVKDAPCTTIRMKGGLVRGSIYGAAQYAGAQGTRLLVFTGGTVKGWIAGGANGTQSDGGLLTGSSYVYVGGNTQVNSNGSTTLINRGVAGNVFGAGCGWTANSDAGKVSEGTNVVIADNAYVERGVYGGGSFGYCATDKTSYIYVTGGHVEGKVGGVNTSTNSASYTTDVIGGVYGGASKNKGGTVILYMTGGLVEGGLYGGSNASGTLSGSVTMQITGGQVGTEDKSANIHGGGYGQSTQVSKDVEITLGKTDSPRDADGVLVYGDVYGGSALGSVNGTAATNTYHTYVTMNAGYIHGSLYGGALGATGTAANVYGPVQVKVYGGSVVKTDETGANGSGAVYGANNINGAPQRSVTVDIYGTNSAPEEGEYALFAVYGGGNHADYTYTETGKIYPQVTVHNCDNSIEYVYGGGNQATVPGTQVNIYGGDVIGNVFGGGNNANVTTNGTDVNIYGGHILNVYGGNNNGGKVTGTINVDVAEQTETGHDLCSVNIIDLYGGGNKAASSAGKIKIGKCSNISNVYGGANQADVTGDIDLTIVDGNVGTVFGGNNNSGAISGNITVTVNWDGTGSRSLGSVYGGGNLAGYSGNPTVNILNGTLSGNVFGGGLGKTAVVVGNPTVNIGDWNGAHSAAVSGNVFGGGDLAAVEGNPTVTIRDCGTTIQGDLYGGGNAAPVYSTNTTMWGGTVMGNVFGGGNGADATKNDKGAQVGYKRDDQTPAPSGVVIADKVNVGDAVTCIYGGTIGTWEEVDGVRTCTSGGGIFGASNTNGNITGKVKLTLDQKECTETGAEECKLVLNEVYGSGNEAAYSGTGIVFNLGCVDALDEIYGGAKNADMDGDIHLKITSGHFSRVFGGNNLGGSINGSIKVTVDETGCYPVTIDELYGCGNNAAYTTPDGKADPVVNIVSCTSVGKVFGGGYGEDATVTGNPTVNINMIPGKFVPGTQDDTNTTELGTVSEVYGGGNAAKVIGNTSVNIGTLAKVKRADETQADADVKGANILGNVYGGGREADVTGKTNVVIGQ